MILYPNAKINLGLNILRKKNNGYHEINSVFYPVKNICDILEIVPSKKFSFSSTGIKINDNNNICIRAFNLFKKDFNIGNVKIHLHKQIPIGAGLGGGSSDGAFTLLMLDKIFNLRLSKSILKKYATFLGADCSFFIENRPSFVFGIGEKIKVINLDLSDYKIEFFFSDLHISTADAYGNIVPALPLFSLNNILDLPINRWRNKIVNDFELPIFQKYFELEKAKERFYNQGAIYSSLTGTGSAIYAIFDK